MDDRKLSGQAMKRRCGLLRKTGMLLLGISLVGAMALYEVRVRSTAVMDDPMLADYSRADTHQMEVLYGKMGTMITDFMDDLKRPGVQAFLIALSGVVIAAGCFFIAGRMEDREEGE